MDRDFDFLNSEMTENDKLELVTEFCVDVIEIALDQKVTSINVTLDNGKYIQSGLITHTKSKKSV